MYGDFVPALLNDRRSSRCNVASPEDEHAALIRELRDLRGTIKSQQREIEIWKKISGEAWARLDEYEKDGAAAVLKRERDQWRANWRNCTRRLGNCIEHLGLEYSGAEPNKDE